MRPDDARGDAPRTTGEFAAAGGFRLSSDVHAWLDGAGGARAPRQGDAAHDVDFWNRLEGDIARRRQVRTPAHVQRAVMAALPVAPRLTPWHRRALEVTPALLALGGAALFALGLALGIAVR